LAVRLLEFGYQRLKEIANPATKKAYVKKAAEAQLLIVAARLHSLSEQADPGLSFEETKELLRLLQAARKQVYGPEPRMAKIGQKLAGLLSKNKVKNADITQYVTIAHTDPLLAALLKSWEIQLQGTVAALQRPMLEKRLEKKYEAYNQPGQAKSTFTRGEIPIPLYAGPGMAAGVIVGATPYEKGMQVLDDTTLLESRSVTFKVAAQLVLGLFKFLSLKFGAGFGIKRVWGKNYENVRHAIRDPDGRLHHQSVRLSSDHPTASNHLAAGNRSTATHPPPKIGFFRKLFESLFQLFKSLFSGLRRAEQRSLHDLDEWQSRAHANRDDFAKWMAHVMGAVDAKKHMVMLETDPLAAQAQKGEAEIDRPITQEKMRPRYIVTSHQRPPTVGLPASFNIKTGALSLDAAVSAGIPQVAMATAGAEVQGGLSKIKFFGFTSFGSAANDSLTEKDATLALQKFCDGQSLTLSMFCPRELSIVPSLGAHEQTLSQWVAHASLEQLERFMGAMEIQFDLYCFSRRQGESNKLALEAARAIEKSLKIAPGKNGQYQYVRILTALNELSGLRLKTLSCSNDASSQEKLFEALGRKLAAPDIPDDRYDRKMARQFCSFSEIVRMTEYAGESRLETYINTSIGNKVGVSLSAKWFKRTDANLLRRGSFLSLTLSFSDTQSVLGDVEGVRTRLVPILTNFLAPLNVNQGVIVESLQPLDLSFGVGAHFDIVWNFYKPFEDASFTRQYTRYLYGYTRPSSMGNFVKKEELGAETLSYLAFLHHTWATQSELPAVSQPELLQATRWEALCNDKKDVFKKVFINLADPDHPLRKEVNGCIDEVMNCQDWTKRFKDLATLFRRRGRAEDKFISRIEQSLQPAIQNDNVDFQQEYWTFFKKCLFDSAENFKAESNVSSSERDAVEEARLPARDLLDVLLMAHAAVWRGSYQNKKMSLKIKTI
jgi:hypothetical protein